MPVILIRTLTREFRIHVDAQDAAGVLAYIETRPQICGPALRSIDLVVRRVGGFYHLALPDGIVAEGTASHLLDAIHQATFKSFVEEVPGAPLIHGASIRIDGAPILLIGATGTGKTTLALRLVERGHVVEGDEHVAVRASDLVARPRTLRVKADSSRFVPTLATEILAAPSIPEWNGSLIYSVSPAIGGNPWQIAPILAPTLVFLEPNHGGHTVAKPVSVERAFGCLMAACLMPNGKAEAAARLRRVAREAQAWEMSLGDLEGAEKHLNRIASSAMHLH